MELGRTSETELARTGETELARASKTEVARPGCSATSVRLMVLGLMCPSQQ